MKTVDIKGKPYVMVNERITFFRENFKDHKLLTEMIANENGICLFRAVVMNEKNEMIATGHAREDVTDGFINKTSYIENCETSAIGRCLACLGIGIDNSIASAEEVANAIKQQNKPKAPTKDETIKGLSYQQKLNEIDATYEEGKISHEDVAHEMKCEWVDLYNVTEKVKQDAIIKFLETKTI